MLRRSWMRNNVLGGLRLLPEVYLVALLALLAGSTASAQTIVTGELAGTIKDGTGGIIPNIAVMAKSGATGETRTATTSSSGDYHFSLLRPGTYTLSVTASGFQPAQMNATAALSQVSTYDIVLGLSSGTFGKITSTVSPFSSPYGSFQGSSASGRIIQTTARFRF